MGVAERRQREREERREQILDAAEHVFFSTSIEASMEEVAHAAELSKGALYLYFSSKDELLTAVMNRRQQELLSELQQTAARDETGLQSLARVMRAYVDFVERWPDHSRLLVNQVAGGQPPSCGHAAHEHHRELVASELGLVLGVIERGKVDGSLRANVNGQELALNMWGGLLGMMLLVLNREQLEWELPPEGQPDMPAAVESFLTLFLRGVAANPSEVELLLEVA